MNLLARASRFAISPLPAPTAWYAIPLRLIVGFGFMQHGYAKLARGPEDFINVLHAIGVPTAFLLGWATIIVEIIGEFLIFIGAFVPLATIPMVIVLLVAIFTVHLPNGFSSIKLQSFDAAGAHFGQPGYETDLLYLAALIALCLGGAGPLSVDGLLKRFQITPVQLLTSNAGTSSIMRYAANRADAISAPGPKRKWQTPGDRFQTGLWPGKLAHLGPLHTTDC